MPLIEERQRDRQSGLFASPVKFWPGADKLMVLRGMLLLAMAMLIVVERVKTFDEPIERDLAGYALIAHEMRQGRQLYSDLWERKPPALYATFGLAERLVGYGPGEIFLLNVSVAIGTMLCAYAAASSSGVAGGLLAAGFWTVLCFDLPTEANQPNGEVFVNLCLTAAVAMLLRWPEKPVVGRALLLGLLLALSTLYEQHTVACCGCLLLGHVFVRRGGDPGGLNLMRRRFLEGAIAAGVIAICWLGIYLYFTGTGRRDAMVDALVRQNLQYAGSPLSNLLAGLLWSHLAPEFMGWVIGPMLLLVIWAAVGRQSRGQLPGEPPRWGMWFCWLVGIWLVVAMPGWIIPHYYQLYLPVLSVGAGWAAAGLLRSNRWLPPLARYAILIAIPGYVLCRQAAPYRLSVADWSALKYPNEHLVEEENLARWLDDRVPIDETFWNFGQENTLYFSARRSPPSGVIYLDPILGGPKVKMYRDRLLADLKRSSPRMLVLTLRWSRQIRLVLQDDPQLRQWIQDNYISQPVNPDFPDYQIWVRKEGGGREESLPQMKRMNPDSNLNDVSSDKRPPEPVTSASG